MRVLLICLVGKINVVNSNQSVFGCILKSIKVTIYNKITLFEMGLAKRKCWFRRTARYLYYIDWVKYNCITKKRLKYNFR